MDKDGKGETLFVCLHGTAPESIVDGPGLRYAVFVQGCPHHCPGCHNPKSHDFSGGYPGNVDTILKEFAENPLLAGVTLSGGEPFAQPAPLAWLARHVKDMGKNVMTYSGYTLEALQELAQGDAAVRELLELTDILVDGPYLEAERDLELLWRGSRNQRLWQKKDGSFEPRHQQPCPEHEGGAAARHAHSKA